MLANELLLPFFEASLLPSLNVEAIVQDSRKASNTSLFVCIQGANADGHKYAEQAYRAGCRLFLAEHPLALPKDATVLITPDSRKILSLIACRFYGDPSQHLQIIGITGTKGKTTTAQMIYQILCKNGISCGYIGTNGVIYGKTALSTENTTPDAVALQKTLSDMVLHNIRVVVLEVSSQALKQHRVLGTRFSAAIFTNLTADHIGLHEHADFEEYKACKARLFTDYGIGQIFLNGDAPDSQYIRSISNAGHIVTFGMTNASSDYLAFDTVPTCKDGQLGISFSLVCKSTAYQAYLPMIGKINAYNALCAIAVTNQLFSIAIEQAIEALRHIQISGRSTQLSLPNGGIVVIDYAHNGESMYRILEALHTHAPRRLMALFGSVGGRSQGRRQELGKAAAAFCDLCILTSDNPGNEDPEVIMDELSGPLNDRSIPYCKIANREEAIRYAMARMQKGDILLLAGKGHENYQLIGKEKRSFSEKEIVLNTIAQMQIRI